MAQIPNGRRTARPQQPRTNTNRSNGNKSDKFANAGAAVGGFVGAMGGSFVPPVNVNVSRTTVNGNGGRRPHSQALMPEPDFSSPSQVRAYCNHLRATAVALSIEVAMGAEILKSVLAAVPDPDGRIGGSRIRAAKVARKLQKSADELRNAAKLAASTYAVFQQEYQEEINRVRHHARPRPQQRMNWTQQ
ncbi:MULTISPECIES: plasmid transfer protein TraA [Streptomyces]|uniref:Sporulation protein SsgA n=1 Tax=Streptomyces venezuelae TaxID=54571 RepID=A0A5P2B125_STRVZ|nr:plasmid transfer protein TraA [Streptomyces venezuelae]QES20442.1 sporulation protein SsgA [Streptomyces venezuelae]QES23478.1 sporulation protein SsgA [Streptomyces venezuelae]